LWIIEPINRVLIVGEPDIASLLAEHSSRQEDIREPTFGSAAALAGRAAGPLDNICQTGS
jgi:hypothetical protein